MARKVAELAAFNALTPGQREFVHSQFYCPPAARQMQTRHFAEAAACVSILRRSGLARREDLSTWRPRLLDMYFIWQLNAHVFGDRTALYRLGSKFQHRCIDPHVAYIDEPDRRCGRFVALQDVAVGDTVTCSYLGNSLHQLLPSFLRKHRLNDLFLFDCTCSDCAADMDTLRSLPCAVSAASVLRSFRESTSGDDDTEGTDGTHPGSTGRRKKRAA